jgi:FixJ family two-component response regulator
MTSALKSSIAVVDDNARTLASIENLLSSAGHSVYLFPSAKDLLNDQILMKIDCLVTDIGMPDIDGFELCRRVRIVREGLPVIFITGRHLAEDQKRSAMSGDSGFFRKPFDASAFLTAVADAVSATNRKPHKDGGSR